MASLDILIVVVYMIAMMVMGFVLGREAVPNFV